MVDDLSDYTAAGYLEAILVGTATTSVNADTADTAVTATICIVLVRSYSF